jgi:hypothetical protein
VEGGVQRIASEVASRAGAMNEILSVFFGTEEEEEIVDTNTRSEFLDHFIHRRRRRYRNLYRLRRILYVLAFVDIAISPIIFGITGNVYWVLYGIIYFVLLVAMARAFTIRHIEQEISDAESELDLIRIPETSLEQRAQKMFKLHEIVLRRYYEQTLRHSGLIFWIGVGCIIMGVSLIIGTLYLIGVHAKGSQMNEKIIIGLLGGLGGILTNFIAVIYMRMFAETVKALTDFHSRLVTTHHLHLAIIYRQV